MLLGKFDYHIMVLLLKRLCFFMFIVCELVGEGEEEKILAVRKNLKIKSCYFFSAKANTNLLFLSLDLLVWNILWWI